MYARMYVCVYVCMRVCMYACMHACMYVYVYVRVHAYLCACTYSCTNALGKPLKCSLRASCAHLWLHARAESERKHECRRSWRVICICIYILGKLAPYETISTREIAKRIQKARFGFSDPYCMHKSNTEMHIQPIRASEKDSFSDPVQSIRIWTFCSSGLISNS